MLELGKYDVMHKVIRPVSKLLPNSSKVRERILWGLFPVAVYLIITNDFFQKLLGLDVWIWALIWGIILFVFSEKEGSEEQDA